MHHFFGAVGRQCREPAKATVASLSDMDGSHTVYIVIGTEYGYLHRASGDVWAFKHASSARRKAKQYETHRV